MSRRDLILNAAADLIADFLYYDRKEDEDLGMDEIEEAITDGEVSVDEILEVFREALEAK